MKKLIKNTNKKIGKSPGSLVYTGDKKADTIKINLIKYDKDNVDEIKITSPDQLEKFKTISETRWINIDGISEIEGLKTVGSIFNIHPLTLEDILNIFHRPKSEDHGDYIFIVIKSLSRDETDNCIKTEHVSLVLKDNLVISFQEDFKDEFEIVRENIRMGKGRLRAADADYLTYRLMDVIIDNYFSIIEQIGDRIEQLEDELIERPVKQTLQKLYLLKNDLIIIRRAVWPLRETISSLEKMETPIIQNNTKPFLRDLYDHIIQLIDTTENYREMIAGMMDIYLSSTSNRLNEIIKVLTIISTIFIPLNFIAGVYGMNFHTDVSPWNMPELKWYFGYPAVLLLMIVIAGLLLLMFKRRKWF